MTNNLVDGGFVCFEHGGSKFIRHFGNRAEAMTAAIEVDGTVQERHGWAGAGNPPFISWVVAVVQEGDGSGP